MIIGTHEKVDKIKKDLMIYFKYEDCGGMKEEVGNNVTRLEEGGLKLTQGVLVQSFKNEYDSSDKQLSTPVAPGSVL